MALRIAVNGFGRIGRVFTRLLIENGLLGKEVEIAVIADINNNTDYLAYNIKNDSVYGKLQMEAKPLSDSLFLNGYTVPVIKGIADPKMLPWKEFGVDLVLESSGRFNQFQTAEKHLRAGSGKVLISAQASGIGKTIVYGVNESEYNPLAHSVISGASCTTNCIAPICHAILKADIGIESLLSVTTHSYTSSQNLQDGYSKEDLRTGRASGINIIPFQTKSPEAVADVIPSLAGKLNGIAYRVPVAAGALVDLNFVTEKETSIAELDGILHHAAETYLKGILEYSREELVSSDIVKNPHSAVYDSIATLKSNLGYHKNGGRGKFFKIVAWYDNEWGYANRLVDLVLFTAGSKFTWS